MSTFKITVVGSGYVGFSLSILLAQQNEVIVYDIDSERVKKINEKKSPIHDVKCEDFLRKKKLNIKATTSKKAAFMDSDFIIIATPTNYNEELNFFDVSTIDNVLDDIDLYGSQTPVIIKSTIPVGYTDKVNLKFKRDIFFSPEFLREGSALQDNLEPSRIIISSDASNAENFVELLKKSAVKKNIPVFFMSPKEAECVKLFSNSYLALRVSFFNELDSYALSNGISAKNIIEGVCSDNRIGDSYNNPSFGYGGYCLPKDTKQLLANFNNVPQNIIKAIVDSNDTRIKFMTEKILDLNPKTIGIYRLTMKTGSDNFREAAITKVIDNLICKKIKILIYEPLLKVEYKNTEVTGDLNYFKKNSDVVVANRLSQDIEDISTKIFSRDLFHRD
jgi:UDPglucose 6-dehydrogenase